MLKKPRRIFREMIKYGMVGALSTIIDYILLNISHHAMGNAPALLWLATAIGFGGGTVNAYFFNSRWTFRYDTKGKEARKLSQFAVVSCVGMGLTMLIVLTLSLKFGLNKNIAKLPAIVIVFFWNFGVNRFWTFRRSASPTVTTHS